MLDFPASPTVNQKYPVSPPAGVAQYTWDGEKWTMALVAAPGIVASDTPPANPVDGMLWFESDSGLLYIYYNDGSSKQWVIAAPQPDFSSYVAKTGDTMTGALDIDMTAPRIRMHKVAGNNNQITGYTGTSPRWGLELGNVTPESGANAGSDFIVRRFADNGALLDAPNPMAFERATGLVTVGLDPVAPLGIATKQYADARALDAAAYSGMQINGGMEVSQELGTTGKADLGYICDGMLIVSAGSMATRGTQISAAGHFTNFQNCVAITVTTALASLGTGGFLALQTRIEGYRVARLNFGTAVASPITIGFWSKHSLSGVYSVAVLNAAETRSYVASYTQAAADVAQYNTVTIPGDVTGTWEKTNLVGFRVYFMMAAGSAMIAPAINTWASSGYYAATGQVNGAASTSNIFRITGVTVLPGAQAPTAAQSPLLMRPYGEELARCQRYFEYIPFNLRFYSSQLSSVNGSTVRFAVEKRAAPTMSAYQSDPDTTPGGSNISVAAAQNVTTKGVHIYIVAPGVGDSYANGYRMSADARL